LATVILNRFGLNERMRGSSNRSGYWARNETFKKRKYVTFEGIKDIQSEGVKEEGDGVAKLGC
jgi:hypothetical protein